MAYVVYCHTNLKNGKGYIGWTSMTMDERWRVHLRSARLGSMCYFHNAIREWGGDDTIWKHEILDVMTTLSGVKHAEKLWISQRQTFAYGNNDIRGYNETLGGDGRCGYVVSSSTKEKLRRINLGRQHSFESRKRNSLAHIGLKHTPQHTANQAAAISKPIAKCDLLGNILEIYPSLTAAAKSINVACAGTRIGEAIKGVRRKTYKGFVWIRMPKERKKNV